jgi:hypothetical protein
MKKGAKRTLSQKWKDFIAPLKYPKFIFFILTFIAVYFIVESLHFEWLQDFLTPLGYFGTFIAGMLYVYEFTAAPAIVIFLALAPEQNIVLAALVGGMGALLNDMLIFLFIRSSFNDEIKKLSNEKIVAWLGGFLHPWVKKSILPILGAIIIASPLPDSLGVSLLAISGHITHKAFTTLSYLLNTTGIFIILLLGKSIF